MIKVAIFDLDSTLIYTQKIKEYIFNFIKQISGESDRFAIQVYNDVRNDAGKITFNLINLKSKLKKSIKNFDENKWKEFEDSFNKVDKSLLIAGAEDLLKFFKGREIPIYILTLGVEDWQKIKIKFSGLEKILGVDFKNLKYTNEEDSKKGKVKEIREILKELNLENCKDILFFNDRPDETKKIGAVILAAGKGTRLGCTDCPKVMMEIGGRPIVSYAVDTLLEMGFSANDIVLVVGYEKEKVEKYFGDKVTYAYQAEQNGTAHATSVVMKEHGLRKYLKVCQN